MQGCQSHLGAEAYQQEDETGPQPGLRISGRCLEDVSESEISDVTTLQAGIGASQQQ